MYKKFKMNIKKLLFDIEINDQSKKNTIGENTLEILNSGLTQPQLCYAQDGEDLVLARLLENRENGFYIDVGAHHPSRFSNTYLFYLRGWSGINIDAQPQSMSIFKKYRPRDINIECGIGLLKGVESYYQFNEPALNTFDTREANIKNVHPYKIIGTVNVEVRRLDEVLEKYLKKDQIIDFMSIDVEGKDLDVLKSNNWSKYRPRYILAETLRADLIEIKKCPLSKYLNGVGYDPICKVYNTLFFERKD